jgi:hypothetical protein
LSRKIGLLGCFVQIFFLIHLKLPNKRGGIKKTKQPWTYKLQNVYQYILDPQYAGAAGLWNWKNSNSNLKSFTASYKRDKLPISKKLKDVLILFCWKTLVKSICIQLVEFLFKKGYDLRLYGGKE